MACKKLSLDFSQKDLFVDVFRDKVYVVGGAVRDFLLYGKIADRQDIDLVVEDCTYDQIEARLRRFGKTDNVGKSFAVIKFTRQQKTFDISIPRRDKKKREDSSSHKNFTVDAGPQVKLREDLERRDFTCNSIAVRLIDGLVYDPFNGIKAIRDRRIAMTGPESFFDDPLRILRAARFASVHRFAIDPEIYLKSKEVSLAELSVERVVDELFRLLLESERPSRGLDEYVKLSILEKLYPELYPLTLTIQDSRFHPETDDQDHHTVWAHTLIAVDIARKLSRIYQLDERRTLALLLATLIHDAGKISTTRWEFKRERMTITSPFHDSVGRAVGRELLGRLRIETYKNYPLQKVILNLIQYHHRLYELYRNRGEIGFKAIARAVKDMEGEDELLVLLDFADRRSRLVRPLRFHSLDRMTKWFLAKKEEYRINRETIKPLLQGRDLIPLGVPPGPDMGRYLKRLYELQLDGGFQSKRKGLRILKDMLQKRNGTSRAE